MVTEVNKSVSQLSKLNNYKVIIFKPMPKLDLELLSKAIKEKNYKEIEKLISDFRSAGGKFW
jgi:hypothetical protein